MLIYAGGPCALVLFVDRPAHPAQEAESLLQQHGYSEGLFLCRAKDPPCSYVLSIVHKQR
jgi:hypothetical protein